MRDVPMFFPRGKVVRDRYVVEALLGKGGSSAVYRVRDRRAKGNIYALKALLRPDSYKRTRFLSEWEILKRLDHPTLPRVYRVFDDDRSNCIYLLMDYIEGTNLELLRLQQPEQRFPALFVLQLMTPIIDALLYLHAQQLPIIHRDIKPANILIPSDHRGAVLIDFGIAKEYVGDDTTTAIRHCSPGYASPEQYMRGTNPRTDIYGLAATFYALLTGSVPVDSLYRMTLLSSHGYDALEPAHNLVAGLSTTVSAVLHQGLALTSSERFMSIEAFWQALSTSVQENTQSPLPLEEASVLTHQPTLPIPSFSDPSTRLPLPGASCLPGDYSPTERVGQTPIPLLNSKRKQPKREGQLILLLPVLTIVILLAGMFFSTRMLPGLQHSLEHIHTLTKVRMTPIPTTPPQPLTHLRHLPGPTSPPAYLSLATRYDGTISNLSITPAISTTITVIILQDGANIHGNVSSGLPSLGNGQFIGTLLGTSTIQFLVSGYGGLPPLFFYGALSADGSLSGSYCSFQNGRCNYASGRYGKWVAYRSLENQP